MKKGACQLASLLPHRSVLVWILLVLFCSHSALAVGTQLTAAQESRAHRLYELFVAPCCWRQCVADHQSPAAAQLREEIDRAVANGKGDSAVKAQLIREFGKRILRVPEGIIGSLLFLVPGVVVLLSLLSLVVCFYRGRSSAQESALTDSHPEEDCCLDILDS